MTKIERLKPYELPLDERLNRIQRIYVRHDSIKHAWKVLHQSRDHGLRLREAASAYIVGHSRCGKSETVKRFIFEKTGKQVVEDLFVQIIEGRDKAGVPSKIVYLDMTNGATPLVATQLMVDKLFSDLTWKQLREAQAAPRLVEWFVLERVDMFIIDEAQQLFNGHGPDSTIKMAKWLLPLENARSFAIALVGAPELGLLLERNPAANERKDGHAVLKPFDFKTQEDKEVFRRFVEQFARDLPFKTSCLSDSAGHCGDWMLYAVYFATRGRPGGLAKLSERATIEAFEDNTCPLALDVDHYARAFDFRLLNDHRMAGVNPFRIKNQANLPQIPLSTDEEDFKPPMPPAGPGRPKRPGGRLHVGI